MCSLNLLQKNQYLHQASSTVTGPPCQEKLTALAHLCNLSCFVTFSIEKDDCVLLTTCK